MEGTYLIFFLNWFWQLTDKENKICCICVANRQGNPLDTIRTTNAILEYFMKMKNSTNRVIYDRLKCFDSQHLMWTRKRGGKPTRHIDNLNERNYITLWIANLRFFLAGIVRASNCVLSVENNHLWFIYHWIEN